MTLRSKTWQRLYAIGITFLLVQGIRNLWLGELVAKFHIDRATAAWGVQLVTGGVGWVFIAAFPYFSPWLLTIEGLIATIGTAATIGW
ncbi:hypothetical protein N2E09_05665 [Leuconostoc citreum]|uniref:hypothetical protein n=1 Tax=Leuconostoc citreum TaxID=33964 RepID=UPI000A1DC777|nr:hypothetical protein [Leuconostoc citreum]MCK8605812.1 hypothetical protein [Leuconostoc citreum]MCP1275845.1 hypothetical protein [Leuconostoc citreum]MCT3067702.1 hypothetical protein [Leuconostoc citreum]OSP81990.1 hypothetical protein B9J75_04885 [Leuconostoc citreum]QEA45433.1 hypothetical protein FGL82_03045 [Leuconostoc citreum]